MMQLIVNDKSLDLGREAKIQIKRQNPAYLGSGAGVIKGDFSFPFELPMTRTNRMALGFPDRIDNAERPAINLPAQLYVGPDLLINGLINVLSAGINSAKVALINNPLTDLTKRKLNEIDYGEIDVADVNELRDLMGQTIDAPLSHDFIFFPVYNQSLRVDTGLVDEPNNEEFQNCWNFSEQRFRNDVHITPFLRTEFILRRAFAESGYTLIDKLHTLPELRRMVLVNNRSLKLAANDYVLKAPLNYFVDKRTIADFVKQLCRIFCLAPFMGISESVVRLESLRGLVAAEPGRDWSEYASKEYERQNLEEGVQRYEYPASAYAESYHYGYWEYDIPQTSGVARDIVDENDELIVVPDGQTFFLEGRSAISERRLFSDSSGFGARALLPIGSFGRIFNQEGNEVIAPTLFPVQSSHIFFYPTGFDRYTVPSVSWSVGSLAEEEDADGNTTYSTRADAQAGLSIFRGLQSTKLGALYPMGSHNNYDSLFNEIAGEDISLNWQGSNGLYERYWREWDDMLKRSGVVSQRFLLPLAELLDFDFSEKVRVGNQNYFVRSMEFTVTNQGISPAKCELLSVS